METKRKKRSALGKLSAWSFGLLRKSLIGKLFTSYDKANERFTKKSSKVRHSQRRKSLERVLENNIFSRLVPKIFQNSLRISTRSYATVALLMSLVVFLLYFLNGRTILVEIYVPLSNFIISICLMLFSIPFLFSKKTLAETLISNKLINFVLFKFFGIYDDSVHEMAKEKRISATTLSFVIGIALGVLSYFVSPILIVGIVLAVIFAYIIFRTPEVGVILTLVLLPFATPVFTKIMIVYILFAYAIKVILRKRIFTFEYHDAWAVVFVVIMTICGLDYQNLQTSISIIVSNLAIFGAYFVVSNLIRSSDWFRKCITAMTASGLIVAGIAITQAVLGLLSVYFSELNMFSEYSHTISATFNSNDVLAQFMVVTIPFALVHVFTQKREIKRIVDLLVTAALVGAMILTASISSFFGIIVGVLLLLIIYNRNFIYLAMVTLASSLGLFVLINENDRVNELVGSAGILRNFNPDAKLEEIGKGFLEFFSWPQIFGTGAGSSTPGVESFPIQLGIEYGIFTLIAFLLFSIVFARLVFSYCDTAKSKNRKINSSAGLCALVGLFTTGLFANVWADEKIMILSVLCVALSFAFIKIQKNKVSSAVINKSNLSAASIDIEMDDDDDHLYEARKYLRAPKNLLLKKTTKKIKPVKRKKGVAKVNVPEVLADSDLEDDDIEDENIV